MSFISIYQTDDTEWIALVSASSKPSRYIITERLQTYFPSATISNMRINRRSLSADISLWWPVHIFAALITCGMTLIYTLGLYIYEIYNPLWEVTFRVSSDTI